MGSPLGPFLADFFISQLEDSFLIPTPHISMPTFYKRYVDDIFCLFPSIDSANKFLTHINTLHPNIKFTIEHEQHSTLPFLDISITSTPLTFLTSVYRKLS